eukprot:TRINITY_DN32818_c0_g1_i1.p1 TRINITY_DN32818_c0_g1~~TRINITY_DN32818_c0_g1_i1.p1  ORF type:complete len:1077 (-),score=350.15 TRINITY_DN32818_c0_g1_i1:118-3348(-)
MAVSLAHHGAHGFSQDAAMASLVRAYGFEDERSCVVQAKLRLVMPSLVSFVASCLSEHFEAGAGASSPKKERRDSGCSTKTAASASDLKTSDQPKERVPSPTPEQLAALADRMAHLDTRLEETTAAINKATTVWQSTPAAAYPAAVSAAGAPANLVPASVAAAAAPPPEAAPIKSALSASRLPSNIVEPPSQAPPSEKAPRRLSAGRTGTVGFKGEEAAAVTRQPSKVTIATDAVDAAPKANAGSAASAPKDRVDELASRLEEALAQMTKIAASMPKSPAAPPGGPSSRKGTVHMGGAGLRMGRQLDPESDISDKRKLELVSALPTFAGLDHDTLEKLALSFEARRYKENEDIVICGTKRPGMHIVASGQVRVTVSKDTGMLQEGQAFGEQALLNDIAVSEGITAHGGEVITLCMRPKLFKHLDVKRKILKGAKSKKRIVMPAQQQDADEMDERHGPDVYPQTDAEKELIVEAAKGNASITEVLTLTQEQCEMMASVAIKRVYKKGDVVFEAGAKGDAFYIVAEGAFAPVVQEDLGQDLAIIASLKWRPYDSFGELALLYDAPRSLTIQCIQDGFCWIVTPSTFKSVIQVRANNRIAKYRQLLEKVPLFENADDDAKDEICNALEEFSFKKGENIVTQGADATSMYLLFGGTCEVIIDEQVVRELNVGDFFGEQSLLRDEPRSATVRATADAKVLSLNRPTFKMLQNAFGIDWSVQCPGRAELMTKRQRTAVVRSSCLSSHLKVVDRIPKSRLERVGFLGQGTFGFVTLERDTSNSKLYALKAISKGHIQQAQLQECTVNEVKCMEAVDSRFIVKLRRTYRDRLHVYLLLEPCFGGELYDVYSDNALWGSEKHARFYAGSVTLGLQQLHERHIIYRDLKLENCLLTCSGQMKLTDLGIAKVVVGMTFTVCGTADYFAPETLRQHGHNRAVDWWALGVLIFIMMSGRSPFEAEDVMQIYKNIIKGIGKVDFPLEMPEECEKLVKALCQKKPEERITMKPEGVDNFKKMDWFTIDDFDWEALGNGNMAAPYSSGLDEEAVAAKIAAKPVQDPPEAIPYEDDGSQWDEVFGEAEKVEEE